jgi:hypothetical protein
LRTAWIAYLKAAGLEFGLAPVYPAYRFYSMHFPGCGLLRSVMDAVSILVAPLQLLCNLADFIIIRRQSLHDFFKLPEILDSPKALCLSAVLQLN